MAHSTRLWLAWLLVAFALLSLVYNVTVPLFEGPDETFHFFYVKQLADGGGLPVADSTNLGLLGPEANQAPLYYVTAALVAGRFDLSTAGQLLWYNPQGNRGVPASAGNKNVVIHTDAEAWPYRNVVLAIHLLRGLGLLLGLAAVLGTFLTARLLLGNDRLALLAAGLNAFLPQFLFSSALVSNDVMLAAWCGLGLYLFLRLVECPGDARIAAVTGVVLGLAALTKLSGLLLLLLAAGVLLAVAWGSPPDRRATLRALFVMGVLAALVAGWWYVRNWTLYGDPTGESVWRAIGYRGDAPIDWWGEFNGLRWSLWGLFGWFSILLPTWLYAALDALTVLAAAGLFLRAAPAIRRVLRARAVGQGAGWMARWLEPGTLRWSIAVGWLLILAVSLVRWNTIAQGFQGRLLFPALPVICVLLVAGWGELSLGAVTLSARVLRTRPSPAAWRYAGSLPPVAALGLLALVVPPLVLAPAYARPPVMTSLPDRAARVYVRYGTALTLVGYRLETRTANGGLPLTLYWQAQEPLDRDYTLAIQALGRDYQPVAKLDTYPGAGAYPTSLWRPGEIIADRYNLRLDPGAERPVLLLLSIHWYDSARGEVLPADPPGVLLEGPKLAPAGDSVPAGKLNPVRFGAAIELVGYRITQEAGELRVGLQWRALSRPDDDYTVFVHVLGPGGQPAAGSDSPPVGGRYPTGWWDEGEFIEDVHVVTEPLPPGVYTIEVGFYRPSDGMRLPVMTANGALAGTDRAVLPEVATIR